MKSRQTFNVQAFKKHINDQLMNCADELVEFRRGLASALTTVLHESGQYKGYVFITREQQANPPAFVKKPRSHGIETDADGNHTFPDETRRRYI